MANAFNASDYGSVPTLNVALTLSLTRRLIVEMPERVIAEPLSAVAAERLRTRATDLRTERLKLLDQPEKIDTRPLDQGEDNAWRALVGRIESLSRLDVPEGKRAAGVLNQVIPDGLGFLGLPFNEQWEESDRLLTSIAEKDLGAELDALCGNPAFRQELARAHQAYGDALGLTHKRPVSDPPAVSSALLALRDAIRFYSRRVVALADEQDPGSIAPVQQALAPILEAQQDARKRRSKGEPEPEPPDEGELPPLPTA